MGRNLHGHDHRNTNQGGYPMRPGNPPGKYETDPNSPVRTTNLSLQATAKTSADEGSYASVVKHYDVDGYLLAKTAADGEHNHWGVYTRDTAVADTADGSPYTKRVSIGGGSGVEAIRWQSMNEWRMEPDAGNNAATNEECRMFFYPNGTGSGYLKFINDAGGPDRSLIFDPSNGTLGSYRYGNDGGTAGTAFESRPNGDLAMGIQGSGPVIKSPDGTEWRIIVDNTGALSTELA